MLCLRIQQSSLRELSLSKPTRFPKRIFWLCKSALQCVVATNRLLLIFAPSINRYLEHPGWPKPGEVAAQAQAGDPTAVEGTGAVYRICVFINNVFNYAKVLETEGGSAPEFGRRKAGIFASVTQVHDDALDAYGGLNMVRSCSTGYTSHPVHNYFSLWLTDPTSR